MAGRLFPFPYADYFPRIEDLPVDGGVRATSYYNNPSLDGVRYVARLGGDEASWNDPGYKFIHYGVKHSGYNSLYDYAIGVLYTDDTILANDDVNVDITTATQVSRYFSTASTSAPRLPQTVVFDGVASNTLDMYVNIYMFGRPIWYELEFVDNPNKVNRSVGYSGYTLFGETVHGPLRFNNMEEGYFRRYVSGIIRKDADMATLGTSDIMFGFLVTGDASGGTAYICINGEVRWSYTATSAIDTIEPWFDIGNFTPITDLGGFIQAFLNISLIVENNWGAPAEWFSEEGGFYWFGSGIPYPPYQEPIDTYNVKYGWYVDFLPAAGEGAYAGTAAAGGVEMSTHPGWPLDYNNPMPTQHGWLWGYGTYLYGTGGFTGADVNGKRVISTPTRLDEFGPGWEKVYTNSYCGVLLHSDGSLYVGGYYASKVINGAAAWTTINGYRLLATGVQDFWPANDNFNDIDFVFKQNGEYYYVGEPTNAFGVPYTTKDINNPLHFTELSGKNVLHFSGGFDYMWCVDDQGDVFVASNNVQDTELGMSSDDWFFLGYDDGHFHQVMNTRQWAATSTGLGGYESGGFFGVDVDGTVWASQLNGPTLNYTTDFDGYETAVANQPVKLTTWEKMALSPTRFRVFQSSNWTYVYVTAAGKLASHHGGLEAQKIIGERSDWVTIASEPMFGDGRVLAICGSPELETYDFGVVAELPPNSDSSGYEAIDTFPIKHLQHASGLAWAFGPAGNENRTVLTVIDSAGPFVQPEFWRDFVGTTELP